MFILYFLIILLTFFGMEAVAWFIHKYIMHGLLWNIHKSHHVKGKGKVEANDSFAVVFAIPSWLCMQFGIMAGCDYRLYIGIGIALYGIAYFLVHDVFIHQRVRWPACRTGRFRNSTNPYMAGLRRAHKIHHKHLSKENGECFGFLFVPKIYHQKSSEN